MSVVTLWIAVVVLVPIWLFRLIVYISDGTRRKDWSWGFKFFTLIVYLLVLCLVGVKL